MPKPYPLQATVVFVPILAALALSSAPLTAAAQQTPVRPERKPRRELTDPRPLEVRAAAAGVASVDRDYRRALLKLSAGQREAARSAALELDRWIPASPADRRAARQQVEVLERLARRDPETLLPALLLHLDLYRHHRAERSYRRIEHHAEMIERASELYAEYAATDEARERAGQALAALGLALLEDRHGTDARRVLARALEIDPDQPAALLGLATDYERTSHYPEAVAALERLVAVRPKGSEARLRLAVNQSRTGRWRDAEAGFQALVDDPGAEDWTVVVAFEELAEMRLRDADPTAAVGLLRAGLGRFPDAERLHIQLAFALERTGDPAAARRAVEELARAPSSNGVSPRERYNRIPESAPALELAGLEENAEEHLLALRTALDAMAEEDRH